MRPELGLTGRSQCRNLKDRAAGRALKAGQGALQRPSRDFTGRAARAFPEGFEGGSLIGLKPETARAGEVEHDTVDVAG